LVYSTHAIKNPSFSEKIKNKALQLNTKGLEMVRLPRQDDFRNFFMREETEKIFFKLEKIINID